MVRGCDCLIEFRPDVLMLAYRPGREDGSPGWALLYNVKLGVLSMNIIIKAILNLLVRSLSRMN
ncbi:MAG: hypothetical protein QG574_3037 [Cyanobacteriota bacterium erpe_2018_sw_21hr_WHONDRS-SW48-000092_B_bin.40]|nr:hypothetical protein [Cyanobacteriota bacterium erpe_2018_sw_21hr_WHONDRS-SW48-000092_B_bin.40]